MKKRMLLVLPLIVFLASCGNAVSELYGGNEYITSDFMQNYYTDWNGIESLQIDKTTEFNATAITHAEDPAIAQEEKPLSGLRSGDQYLNGDLLEWNTDYPQSDYGIGYGPTKNLSSVSNAFSYGYLSKLYDGRVRCDGYYAKSRVQLDKIGYGTYFPKELMTYKYFAMAIRGGTDCERDFNPTTYPTLDFNISFYKPNGNGSYDKISIQINDLSVITNAGGRTYFVNFYFDTLFGDQYSILQGVTAMSMTFSLKTSQYADLTDDMTDTTKKHFSLMLYEVFLPDSSWR